MGSERAQPALMLPGGTGARALDATIGANLGVHVSILFHWKDSWLGIVHP